MIFARIEYNNLLRINIMKKRIILLLIIFLNTLFLQTLFANEKKVLFVNSYHKGYLWSDKVEETVYSILKNSDFNVEIKSIYMDTKKNKKESFKLKAALRVKKLIESYKPDVIVTSDDNAAKYLIVPYYMNSKLPIVFTGINNSAKKYGFPAKNVTGVLEVKHIDEALIHANEISNIKSIGFLAGDDLSNRSDAKIFEKTVGFKIRNKFVSSLKEWKKEFIYLQSKVDLLIVGNVNAINTMSASSKELKAFAYNHTNIPTFSWNESMSSIVLMVLAKSAEEQGLLASQMVLDIFNGKKIKDIPITKNKNAAIYINLTLLKKLDVIFPFDLMDNVNFTK